MSQAALPGVSTRESYEWPDKEVLRLRDGSRITLRNTLVAKEPALVAMRERLECEPFVVYDSETSGLFPHLGARICGHVFSCWDDEATISNWYMPVRHRGPANDGAAQIRPEVAAEVAQAVLAAEGECGFHHYKFDAGHLRADGVILHRKPHDVAVRAVIHDENEKSFALKRLATKYVYEGASAEEKTLADWMRKDARRLKLRYKKRDRDADPDGIGELTYLERFGYSRTPIELCGIYGCHDGALTLLLMRYYRESTARYHRVYEREMQCARILHEMQFRGLPVNAELIRETHAHAKAAVQRRLANVRTLVGDSEFTASDGECRKLFYGDWGLAPPKYTKGKLPAVDKEARENLERKHTDKREAIEAIASLAKARKILSTYSVGFLDYVSPESRIHPSYNQLEGRDEGGFPVTGRLSSSDPNIQNIAKKPIILDDFEVNIRRYFPVPAGHVRVWIDWSQIELRALAWFSQDPKLLDCYANDLDVHQMVADSVCGGDRGIAKQVNFGNGYGMTEHGLSRRLVWADPITGRTMRFVDDPDEALRRASKVMRDYFDWLAGIPQFRRNFAAQMRADDCMFVNPFGRPRRIPSLVWKDRKWREKGERQMMSSIISGTCADLMKEAMIRCDAICRESHLHARLVQTVHDELVFDVPLVEGWASLVLKLVHAMTDFPMFPAKGVPLQVSVELSTKTWGDKKTITITDDGQFLVNT